MYPIPNTSLFLWLSQSDPERARSGRLGQRILVQSKEVLGSIAFWQWILVQQTEVVFTALQNHGERFIII